MKKYDGQEEHQDKEETTKTKKAANSKGRKGKKTRQKDKSKPQEREFLNDPSFYFRDPTLMDQVSSFSFNEFLGANSASGYRVPYAMRLLFNPSCGWSGPDTLSGVNVAARKLHTVLSSMNAKTTQYAPQDIAMLLLSLGEVLSVMAWIRRSFRLAFTYNKRNWFYPKEIINVCGIDDDFLLNLADYRMRYNSILNMINQISFPADVTWFKKCDFMYSHIFLDSESPMAQSYVFVPYSTWILDEMTSKEGSKCATKRLWQNQDATAFYNEETEAIPMSVALDHVQTMIESILSSSTFVYIFADVLRVYGEKEFVTLPFLKEDEVIMPVYDPMVNLQINNMNIIPFPEYDYPSTGFDPSAAKTAFNDVESYVNNNGVEYCPQFGWSVIEGTPTSIPANTAFPDTRWVLNFPHSQGNPDVYQRVECTRMLNLAKTVAGSPVSKKLATVYAAIADHYCTKAVMYDTRFGGATQPEVIKCSNMVSKTDASLQLFETLDKFLDAPRVLRNPNETLSLIADGRIMSGDLDYYTEIDLEYLVRVNDLAYVCLFEV